MKGENWAVTVRYAAVPGTRPKTRRHPSPEDFGCRTVIGPAELATVVAALDLLDVPEKARETIFARDVVRAFSENNLKPDHPYGHHTMGGYYVSDMVDAQFVEWSISFAFVTPLKQGVSEFVAERNVSRDRRQAVLVKWATQAFGAVETTNVPQRGLRLLEEAIEAYQACGGEEAIAHKLISFVFERPPGTIGQELGGVAVTVMLLAAAAGLSADEEECREFRRVLNKSLREFAERNASKNEAGFLVASSKAEPTAIAAVLPPTESPPSSPNSCCGNAGTHGEGGREYCSSCGADLGARAVFEPSLPDRPLDLSFEEYEQRAFPRGRSLDEVERLYKEHLLGVD